MIRLTSAEKGEWLAMSRNISQTGALLATARKLVVGQDVILKFKLTPEEKEPREIAATIVRVEPNAEDPSGMWPHRIAVEFDESESELEELIAEDAERWSDEYLVEMEDDIE